MLCKMLKKWFSIPLVISLTACAHTTTETVRTVHDYCLLAKGQTYSEPHGTDQEDVTNKYDTTDTVKQIKDHDLVYEKTCS